MGIKAALYTRRSTDEHQESSLEVQREEALRFIAAKGWTLADEHIFVDDAVSRAEFKKRPGLIALLNAAATKAFDVVVVRDETRLGGDMHRTGLVIQDLLEAGVQLWYYYADEQVTIDGAVDKFLVAARSFAAELEREKIAQRVHEHLMTKARKGYNVGGRVYGYDNVEVHEGDRRVRVEYKINEREAEIVREIFKRYAAGEGLKAIAKDLNTRGLPPPSAGKRGTGSWSQSAIQPMLRRDRYEGRLVWGKETKAYRGGTKVRLSRAEEQWIVAERPELRIVPRELWDAVQERIAKHERMTGRAGPAGPRAKYLLSGLARCDECGGPISVSNGKWGAENVKVYSCAYHRNRGDAVCKNAVRRPVDRVDEAVIDWIEQNVLKEELIVAALDELRRRLQDRTQSSQSQVPPLETELKKLKGEVDRLTAALASSDDPPEAVVKAIVEREKKMTALKGQIQAVRATPMVLDTEVRAMEEEARRRLGEFRALLSRNPAEARKVVEAVLEAPLTFTPTTDEAGRRRYRIEGQVVGAAALFTTESDPSGIRTRVHALKGHCPGPG